MSAPFGGSRPRHTRSDRRVAIIDFHRGSAGIGVSPAINLEDPRRIVDTADVSAGDRSSIAGVNGSVVSDSQGGEPDTAVADAEGNAVGIQGVERIAG